MHRENAYNMKAVNAIIFIVIGILGEDPLSTGMLDVFFLKISYHVSLLLRELYILRIYRLLNSFYSILPVEVCSSIPSAEMSCLSGASPLIRPRRLIHVR
jgi:hypothetical protein